jgi:Na+-translocating ferredoxin:NAD+ oxidoreductase RnfD subunit
MLSLTSMLQLNPVLLQSIAISSDFSLWLLLKNVSNMLGLAMATYFFATATRFFVMATHSFALATQALYFQNL